MAMTPAEMHEFFGEQAELFWNGARQTHEYYVAAENASITFDALLMQGLIGWRCNLESPVRPFMQAIERISDALKMLQTLQTTISRQDLPLESAMFVGFLVDTQTPTPDRGGLAADRLLDAVLGTALCGDWDERDWARGMDKLRLNNEARLAADSYATYAELLCCPRDDADPVVMRAANLFEKRSTSAFFDGGHQSNGGGPDNAITVDYRLSAIMKRIGLEAETLHSWRW